MSAVLDAVRAGRAWLRRHAAVLLIPVAVAVLCPPTRIPDLVPALRTAAGGNAVSGTFRLDSYHSGKTGRWWGEFRSDDGRTVIGSTDLDGVDAGVPQGTRVRAFVITRRQVFWGPPTAYTGKNANYIWVPLVATLYWSGVAAAALVWIRGALRRRHAPRVEPPRPHRPGQPCDEGCSCATPSRGGRRRARHPS